MRSWAGRSGFPGGMESLGSFPAGELLLTKRERGEVVVTKTPVEPIQHSTLVRNNNPPGKLSVAALPHPANHFCSWDKYIPKKSDHCKLPFGVAMFFSCSTPDVMCDFRYRAGRPHRPSG